MSADPRPTVLVLTEFYLPAYRVGGPVRSLANLVERLGDRIRFRIVATPFDLGGTEPLPGIVPDAWQARGRAEVTYLSDPSSPGRGLAALLAREAYDVLYLNSLFSPAFSLRPLLLRRLGRLPRRPVVMAPRGQLYPGALAQKRAKKRAFLALARLGGLYSGLRWQATTDEEAEQVRRWFGRGADVVRAGNLGPPAGAATAAGSGRTAKRPGELRIAFLSRVSPIKNLDGALAMVAGVRGSVVLDVWGPHEDAAFLARCRALAGGLPGNVRVEFRGPVEHAAVGPLLAGYHLFLLPTLSENFGHAIADALAAGCPVLVSDRTPWRGLAEREAGWDVPLERPAEFTRIMQECVEMDQETWSRWSAGALRLAAGAAAGRVDEERTLRLFLDTAAGARA
ncbi:MAG: glycosyl transferase, group 1 [Gemmatimonadetes bacterium]|nr:glycosyl transferase, group 1 [Gemmatimonadota bacterium]